MWMHSFGPQDDTEKPFDAALTSPVREKGHDDVLQAGEIASQKGEEEEEEKKDHVAIAMIEPIEWGHDAP